MAHRQHRFASFALPPSFVRSRAREETRNRIQECVMREGNSMRRSTFVCRLLFIFTCNYAICAGLDDPTVRSLCIQAMAARRPRSTTAANVIKMFVRTSNFSICLGRRRNSNANVRSFQIFPAWPPSSRTRARSLKLVIRIRSGSSLMK